MRSLLLVLLIFCATSATPVSSYGALMQDDHKTFADAFNLSLFATNAKMEGEAVLWMKRAEQRAPNAPELERLQGLIAGKFPVREQQEEQLPLGFPPAELLPLPLATITILALTCGALWVLTASGALFSRRGRRLLTPIALLLTLLTPPLLIFTTLENRFTEESRYGILLRETPLYAEPEGTQLLLTLPAGSILMPHGKRSDYAGRDRIELGDGRHGYLVPSALSRIALNEI